MRDSTNIKKNSAYNMIKTCVQMLFPLITYPYVLRILLPDNMGKYNFSVSIATYFSLIATLGVSTYAIRECAKEKEDRERLGSLASQIYTINMCTTAISLMLLFIAVFSVPKLNSYRALILIQGGSILLSTLGTDWLFSAVEDFRFLTLRTIFAQVAGAACIFLLVRKPEDYVLYAIINVLSLNGVQIINLFYRRKYCIVKIVSDKTLMRHVTPILLLFSMMFAQQILASSDSVMLGFFRNDYEVGIYGVASKIYSVLNSTVASITWVLLPGISAAYASKDGSDIKSLLRYGISIMVTLGIPVVAGTFFLAPEMVLLLGGSEYSEAVILVQIIAFVLLLSFAGNIIFNLCLLAAGRDKICALNCIFNATLNIVLNLIFIPKYGAVAAALTTLWSMVFSLLFALPFVNLKLLSFKIKEFSGAIIEAAIIWGVVELSRMVFSDIIVVFFSFVVSVIVYMVILLLTKNELFIDIVNKVKRRR